MNHAKRGAIKWICLVAVVLCGLMPLTGSAEESAMPWSQLEREAKEGLLLPLPTLDERLDAVVEGAVYGYGTKLYQTWFEVGDDALFEAVGVSRPQGTMAWSELMSMAEAVEKYNQESEETVWLLATLDQRFPNAFSPMNQGDIGKQWEAIQSVVCSGEPEGKRALLKECVLPIELVGHRDYIASIQSGDSAYPLAGPEMRYAAIRRDDPDADAQATKLVNAVKEASPAETGIVDPDLSYEQFLEGWHLSMPAPSEANFELWKQSGALLGL